MTPKNIQTPEELYPLCEAIHTFLKQRMEMDNITLIIERGHDMAAYMANTGKMLSDAKYWKDEAMKNSILKQVGSKFPASILNELIKSECKDINYLVNHIEQLDKECKYQLEWLRSCLSTEKEQMKMNTYTSNVR